MLEVGREWSFAVAKETDIKHDAAIKAMKEKGVTFYDVPLKEKQEWMRRLGNLADEKAKEADKMGQPGTQVLKTYVKEMSAAGHEWPVKWEIK